MQVETGGVPKIKQGFKALKYYINNSFPLPHPSKSFPL